jgi:hypothetical protein
MMGGMTTPKPNAAQFQIPEGAETLVMSPRELALYRAGEALGIAKAQRQAAQVMTDLAGQMKADQSAPQLAALLDQAASKAASNAEQTKAALMATLASEKDEPPVEPKLVLSWADMANALVQVKDHPLAFPKQAAEVLENASRALLQQAVQGDHVFAAKLAEVSGLTAQQVKAKPSLLGAVARLFLEELAKR